MGKLAGIGVVVVVAVIGVFAVVNSVGGIGGGEAVRTVIREAPDKDDGKDKDKDREPGSVEGEHVTWRGPLVDNYDLDGVQMDGVFERVRECLPVERAQFLELCLQGRESDWYDEGGYDGVSEAEE